MEDAANPKLNTASSQKNGFFLYILASPEELQQHYIIERSKKGEIVTRIKQHKICFCLRLSEVESTGRSTIKTGGHTVLLIKSNRKGNDF